MPMRQDNIPDQVTPELMVAFKRSISPERWRTYERSAGFNSESAHKLYLWNAAVGQSFHYPLQTVEVCLRNVIHLALADIYSVNWTSDPNCRNILRPKQVSDIIKAERRHYSIYGVAASSSQVVASLSLGFWVALLRREYNHVIWATHIGQAFPHLGPNESIIDVSRTGTKVQDLRNRIFHQEPLIGHNLTEDYSAILRLIGWICPEMRAWTRRNSSVPKIIRERPR
ncbi:MAG: hypothetical protein ABL882_06215 [Sphingopyxis sp.]